MFKLYLCALVVIVQLELFSFEQLVVSKNQSKYSDVYSYLAELLKLTETICNGAIIRDNVVLLAAHCINKGDIKQLTVRAGNHIDGHHGQIRDILAYNENSKYGYPRKYDNDITLVILKTPFTLNEFVNTIILPTKVERNKAIEKQTAKTIGWRRINDSAISAKVTHIQDKIFSGKNCYVFSGNRSEITDGFICTSGRENKDGICFGNTGTLLVERDPKNNQSDILLGIGSVSYKLNNSLECIPWYPSLYIDISTQNHWIISKTELGQHLEDNL